MDAHAHLLSLGWAGPGHALDARPYKQKGHRGLAYDPKQAASLGNGLIKPLLISQRRGRLGIGKKSHEPQAGNEWWLKGFENALGNIGKSESERSSGTSTPDPAAYTGKHTGLYAFFVKGQTIEGTIGNKDKKSKKRKSDQLDEEHPKTSKARYQRDVSDFEKVGSFISERDKDEKRKQRKTKTGAVEQFEQAQEYFGAIAKPKRGELSISHSPNIGSEEESKDTFPSETKEQRKERRRKRKEEKAARKTDGSSRVGNENDDVEDEAAKAFRRAERKRRKAESVNTLNG